MTVCKSFGYLESPAPGLIIETGHKLDNYPTACLSPSVFTVSTHHNEYPRDLINTTRTDGRTSGEEICRSERNSLAVCAADKCLRRNDNIFPRPISTYHLHDNISSAPPVFSVLRRKLGKIMCAHARTETRSCSMDENLQKKNK